MQKSFKVITALCIIGLIAFVLVRGFNPLKVETTGSALKDATNWRTVADLSSRSDFESECVKAIEGASAQSYAAIYHGCAQQRSQRISGALVVAALDKAGDEQMEAIRALMSMKGESLTGMRRLWLANASLRNILLSELLLWDSSDRVAILHACDLIDQALGDSATRESAMLVIRQLKMADFQQPVRRLLTSRELAFCKVHNIKTE